MTPEAGNALRKSLNQIDRDRKRAAWLIPLLFAFMAALWFGMMFSRNNQTGLAFGLAAVIEAVFIAGLMVVRFSNKNTQAILKAIELLSEKKPDGEETPPSPSLR